MSTDPDSADVAAILPEPSEVVPEPASGGAFGAPAAISGGGGLPDERPEVLVGGAFLGGFLVAKLLKRLG